jgi:uncharacterized protein YoxC
MSTGGLAALIAAGFWAVGVCVGTYVLIKLAGLVTEATRFVAELRSRTDVIVEQAHAAIDRTNQQLDRTGAIATNLDQVTANVADLTENVTVLADLARGLAEGPVGKVAGVAYGVRRAVGLRRTGVTPVQAGPVQAGPVQAQPAGRSVP